MHSIINVSTFKHTYIKNNTDIYTNKCKKGKQRIMYKSITKKARDSQLSTFKFYFKTQITKNFGKLLSGSKIFLNLKVW